MPNHQKYNFGEKASPSLRQVDGNIFALRLEQSLSMPKNAHSFIPFISEFSQKKQLRSIEKALKFLSSRQSILINFSYTSYLFHESNLFLGSIFILNDDFINKAPNRFVFSLAKRFQNKTAKHANICLAVSTPLVEQLKNVNPKTFLFLPGHSFVLENLEDATMGEKNRSQEHKKIKVAFMGYISNRLELDWIVFAASHHDIAFFLVGPNQLNASETEKMKKHGVQILPPLTDQNLWNFLTSCDVLTVPYALRTDTISITAPNKLFQYIASGKPVISSNLPHLLDLPPSILTKATTKEDFVHKIVAAYQSDTLEQKKKRLQLALENRWEKRGEDLFKIICSIASKSDSMHMQML